MCVEVGASQATLESTVDTYLPTTVKSCHVLSVKNYNPDGDNVLPRAYAHRVMFRDCDDLGK